MTDDTGGGASGPDSTPAQSLDRHQPPRRVPGFAPGVERFGTALLVGTLTTAVLFTPLAALLPAGLLAFVLYFFRDPDRSPPEARVVAPADGRVSVVREEGDRVRVGVFMNVTDVHVNRAPADGEVVEVTRRPGANRPAFAKDSDRNERVDVDCGDYELSLIAGWFARRIHPYVTEGDSLRRGERVGHIDFGSRADVLLPAEVDVADVAVAEGETVRAGETVLVA
jgi:phosphatidylserine decarboxylase